jgi:hypothetical protein
VGIDAAFSGGIHLFDSAEDAYKLSHFRMCKYRGLLHGSHGALSLTPAV